MKALLFTEGCEPLELAATGEGGSRQHRRVEK